MRDTEGAIRDLKMARSYLDDWGKDNRIGTGQRHLTLATKYIQSAIAKDPDAGFIPEGKTYTENADSLSASALYYEAHDTLHGRDLSHEVNKPALLEAKALLNKALEFKPDSILYRHKLADIHLNLYDQPGALKLAQEALALSPHDMECMKFLDRIEGTPNTSPPTYFDKNPEVQRSLMAAGVYLGLVAIIALSLYHWNFFIAAAAAGGIFWYSRYRERIEVIHAVTDSIQDDIKKGKWRG